MTPSKSKVIGGNTISLYTDDGYWFVYVYNKADGLRGEPEKFDTVEEALAIYDAICHDMEANYARKYKV